MNLKKYIFINTIIIFILSFIAHQIYDWLPNIITSIFFPVNESVWEHMKMIFSSYLLYSLIEYLLLKKNVLVETVNIPVSTLVTSVFNIIIFLLIYIPIYNTFGENIIITLIIYFITIFISQILNHILLLNLNIRQGTNIIPYIITVLIYIVFVYLTYYPIETNLFYDETNKNYGIIQK